MKELHIDRFDALLSLAAAECVRDEAAAFLSADVSEIEDDPKMLRKILGVSRQSKWKAIKLVALVALLCMSIAFTACMLVPEIRNAVWNVLVKGHGDHVEIGFGTGESEEATDPPVTDFPETIEQKMVLTYVPEGCVKGEEVDMSSQYHIYYYSESGELLLHITQNSIINSESYMDCEKGHYVRLRMNNYDAILIENFNDEIMYSLIWQDEQYRYTLNSSFFSGPELVRIAEGIIT